MRLAIANLKGGVTKTTSAVFLAAGLARRGRTLLVDADPTGSAASWSDEAGDFPVTVTRLDKPRRFVEHVADLGSGYAHVVIDTPPLEPALVRAAVLSADMVLIPVSPSAIDVDRLRATIDLIAEVEAVNAPELRVMLAKARAGTNSRAEVRKVLDDLGVPLMTAEIPLRERYAQAWGTVPAGDDPDYAAVLAELGQ
jgi:chromosome partitioning protein